jgi:hypothetical protein
MIRSKTVFFLVVSAVLLAAVPASATKYAGEFL